MIEKLTTKYSWWKFSLSILMRKDQNGKRKFQTFVLPKEISSDVPAFKISVLQVSFELTWLKYINNCSRGHSNSPYCYSWSHFMVQIEHLHNYSYQRETIDDKSILFNFNFNWFVFISSQHWYMIRKWKSKSEKNLI